MLAGPCLCVGGADAEVAPAKGEYQPLAPVLVTGQAPAEIGQSSAMSWSVLDVAEVQPWGVTSIRDLPIIAPELGVFDANNDRAPRFSLRGLRENNFGTGEPDVGLYIDGVPYLDLTSRGAPLFDLERIEFLRGPQGTLLGAAGPAGTIVATSRPPDNIWRGEGSFGLGSHASLNGRLSLSGPIQKDQLAFGVTGLFDERDGYVRNLVTGHNIDDHQTLAGRALLRWTPSDRWDVRFETSALRFRDGFVPTYYPAVDAGPFKVLRDTSGFVNTDENLQAFRVGYTTERVKVVSITTRRDWDQELSQDFDFSPFPGRIGFNNPGLVQWTEELRLQSPEDEETLRWLTGFFFADRSSRQDSGSTELTALPELPPPPVTFRTLARQRAETLAGFGQVTWRIRDNLDVVGGLRATFDNRRIERSRQVESGFLPGGSSSVSKFAGSEDFTALQPKVGVSWRVTPALEAYASYAMGYQSGGFNTSNDQLEQAAFDPSRSHHFEVGARSSWFDNRLHVDMSLFYIRSDDYPVYRIGMLDPSQAFLVNADRADSLGAELELSARPVESLDLFVHASYTDATYERFIDPVTGEDLRGNRIGFVPLFTVGAGMEWRLPAHLTLRTEVQTVGNYALTELNDAHQDTYALVHARLGWSGPHWEAAVFARNLFDKHYARNALDLRNAFQPDLLVYQPGDPLTFGVVLTARF